MCDCVVSGLSSQAELRYMWSRGLAVVPKYSVPAIKTFRQCLSSLIVPWKTNPRLWRIGSRFSFGGLALGFEPLAGFEVRSRRCYHVSKYEVGLTSDFPLLISLYLFGESANYLTDKNIMI